MSRIIVTGSDTTRRVTDALESSGYSDTQIVGASLAGVSESGKEVHDILFRNPDSPGGLSEGRVFVWRDGEKLVADF